MRKGGCMMMDTFVTKTPDTENELQITKNDNGYFIELENPWYGDSDTGFGVTLSFELSFEEADKLKDFFIKNNPIKK